MANAVVTGASSGIGRAVAVRLAQAGWSVAIVARREQALRDVAAAAGAAGARMLVCPCDIGDPAAIDAMARAVLDRFRTVDALVNSAGTNTPNRSLAALDLATYRQVLDVNLTGTYACVQAFLPAMRARRSGIIVNISSDSGLKANAKAGAAYSASKFAVGGLTQAINAEERANGIRATVIFPGDVDTPLLDRRPNPPTAEARKSMLQPEDVADCVMLAINLPQRAVIEELLIRPR